jgi:hypothetical protein
MIELMNPPCVEQHGTSRMNLSVEAMMRLHFGEGGLWCEDSTDDCKSENHNTII